MRLVPLFRALLLAAALVACAFTPAGAALPEGVTESSFVAANGERVLELSCEVPAGDGKTFEFALPELPLGIVPDAGALQRLPRRLPYNIAMEMFLLGRRMKAEEAARYGLVNKVVPAEELEATAMKAAKRLAAKPREALMTARRLMRGSPAEIDAMIDKESSAYQTLMKSPEAKEAFTAFIEKRAPDFAKARASAKGK